MLVLITYDVTTVDQKGRSRLRRVAKCCTNWGQRVQDSVFECVLDISQLAILKSELVAIIDHEKDSLRFYLLGSKRPGSIEHYGCSPAVDYEGPLVV